jgi:hypothetical protein
MPVFLLLLKKIAPYLKYIAYAAIVLVLLFMWHSKSNLADKTAQDYELYKRQMSGQLLEKEKQLEAANYNLGVAQSKFMTQDALDKQHALEDMQKDAAFEKFKKDQNLEIESYQLTIGQLQEQLKNKGTTAVTVNNPREKTDPQPDEQFDHLIDPKKEKLSYDWKSGDGRFELFDSDIFVSDTVKTFTLNQSFRISGEIYRQKVGFLKTERLLLEEVVISGKDKNGSPQYKMVGQAKIVDSHFNYTEEPPVPFYPHKGYFGIWPTISANLGLADGLNPHFLVGLGVDWINYKGLGSGVNIYVDTTTIQQSAFGINVSYRPTILGHQLNVGLSVGIATEFLHPFQSWTIVGGLPFYLW